MRSPLPSQPVAQTLQTASCSVVLPKDTSQGLTSVQICSSQTVPPAHTPQSPKPLTWHVAPIVRQETQVLKAGPGRWGERFGILPPPAPCACLPKFLQRLVGEHREAGAKEEAGTGHIASEACGGGGRGAESRHWGSHQAFAPPPPHLT